MNLGFLWDSALSGIIQSQSKLQSLSKLQNPKSGRKKWFWILHNGSLWFHPLPGPLFCYWLITGSWGEFIVSIKLRGSAWVPLLWVPCDIVKPKGGEELSALNHNPTPTLELWNSSGPRTSVVTVFRRGLNLVVTCGSRTGVLEKEWYPWKADY